MAWNKPAANPQPKQKKPSAKPSLKHGIIAGAAVVVLGLAALWIFSGGDTAPKAKAEKRIERIKEVTPAPAKKTQAEKPQKPKGPRPQRVGEIRDGYRLLPSGRLHKVVGVVTSGVHKTSLLHQTFKHSSDRRIAELLTVTPGDFILGDGANLYQTFDKDFDEALKEDVTFSDDDTETQRILKEGVIDIREQLKERRASGEDLNAIMRNARNQLQELGMYKHELEQEVIRIVKEKEDMTKKDYKELMEAANKMLEERGSRPLELSSSLYYNMRLKRQNKNKEQKK